MSDTNDPAVLLDKACHAVLLFHSAGPWDDAKKETWFELTGEREATTKVLCDFIRDTLKAVENLGQ